MMLRFRFFLWSTFLGILCFFGLGISPALAASFDFGDAPRTFPVTFEQNGARTKDTSEVWLGDTVTQEEDANLPGQDAGNDGVWMQLESCKTSRAYVSVHIARPGEIKGKALLNIFADWNEDGVWSGEDECAAEWVVRNYEIDLSQQKTTEEVYAIDFPAGMKTDGWWRAVLTKDELLTTGDGTGEFRSGEVEDDGLSEDLKKIPNGVVCKPRKILMLHGTTAHFQVVPVPGGKEFDHARASVAGGTANVLSMNRKGHFLVRSTQRHSVEKKEHLVVDVEVGYGAFGSKNFKKASTLCHVYVTHKPFHNPPPPDPPPPDPPEDPPKIPLPPLKSKWIETKHFGPGDAKAPQRKKVVVHPYAAACGSVIVPHGSFADIEMIPEPGASPFVSAELLEKDRGTVRQNRELVTLPGLGKFRYWSLRKDGPTRMEKDTVLFNFGYLNDQKQIFYYPDSCRVLIEHKDTTQLPPIEPPKLPELPNLLLERLGKPLTQVQEKLQKSSEQLANGLDEGASKGVVKTISTKQRVVDQAEKKISEGLTLLNATEEVNGEIAAILVRLKQIIGKESTLSWEQSGEVDQLVARLDQIAKNARAQVPKTNTATVKNYRALSTNAQRIATSMHRIVNTEGKVSKGAIKNIIDFEKSTEQVSGGCGAIIQQVIKEADKSQKLTEVFMKDTTTRFGVKFAENESPRSQDRVYINPTMPSTPQPSLPIPPLPAPPLTAPSQIPPSADAKDFFTLQFTIDAQTAAKNVNGIEVAFNDQSTKIHDFLRGDINLNRKGLTASGWTCYLADAARWLCQGSDVMQANALQTLSMYFTTPITDPPQPLSISLLNGTSAITKISLSQDTLLKALNLGGTVSSGAGMTFSQ